MLNKAKEKLFTVTWLREQMAYEPETGEFLWKVSSQGRRMNRVLGTTLWDGYRVIKVANHVFFAHRLAWFYVHGEWPNGSIDHIDGDRANNAIENLRVATAAQNAARRKTRRVKSPSRGVFPQGVGFVARIHHGGTRHYLGYFSTKEEARDAYEAAAEKIHGEFAHKKHESEPRDFINATACEMCGSENELRTDYHPPGIIPRGTLCRDCYLFVSASGCDLNNIQRLVDYIHSLNSPMVDARTFGGEESVKEAEEFYESRAGRNLIFFKRGYTAGAH